jgi:hypothetical protein
MWRGGSLVNKTERNAVQLIPASNPASFRVIYNSDYAQSLLRTKILRIETWTLNNYTLSILNISLPGQSYYCYVFTRRF